MNNNNWLVVLDNDIPCYWYCTEDDYLEVVLGVNAYVEIMKSGLTFKEAQTLAAAYNDELISLMQNGARV